MGLPNINIAFIGKGQSAITRSARGVVALILRDELTVDEGTSKLDWYTALSQVDFKKMSEANYDFMKLVFADAPSKVMVVTIKVDGAYDEALKVLEPYKWNYLTVPAIATEDVASITSWIKEQRDQNKKTFKAILANTAADHEGIINCTTEAIETTITNKTHTAAEYCARIAGMIAGLPLNRSATYYELADVVSAVVPVNPDEKIDLGELIIVFDGTKFKIGRAVNSLKTFTEKKTKELSKIKIIEGKDMINDDITATFADLYIGKFINNYDNKQMLVAAIQNYFSELAGNVLDPDFANTVSVDQAAQIVYLKKQGIDVEKMSDQELLTSNTGSTVFLQAAIKFVDAMEDLTFSISM